MAELLQPAGEGGAEADEEAAAAPSESAEAVALLRGLLLLLAGKAGEASSLLDSFTAAHPPSCRRARTLQASRLRG